jgi:methionine-S-sulfoxide reductase
MQDGNNQPEERGSTREVAVVAGGCFWGVEEILRDVPGVLETEVGYTGGWLENPTYDDTHDSKSGHAEAVRITFDPSILSYEELLDKWFFRLHDPTTLNRQGNDIGTQYRSAIFPQNAEQQRTAAEEVSHDGTRHTRPVHSPGTCTRLDTKVRFTALAATANAAPWVYRASPAPRTCGSPCSGERCPLPDCWSAQSPVCCSGCRTRRLP